MKRALLVLFLSLSIAPATYAAQSCQPELRQITDFANRESERLSKLLNSVKPELELLPAREKLHAKLRWVEANSARLELEKLLSNSRAALDVDSETGSSSATTVSASQELSTLECAQEIETIRARLFRSQELGFNLSLDYDERMRPQPSETAMKPKRR